MSPSVKTHCFASRGTPISQAALTRSRMNASGREPLRSASRARLLREDAIRQEERCSERARIGHELHDTLLQGFLGASLLLHAAMEQTGADAPSRPALSRALHLVRRAIDEGRAAIRGLQVTLPRHQISSRPLRSFWTKSDPPRVQSFESMYKASRER